MFWLPCVRQDSRAADGRGSRPAADDRGGGHARLAGVLPGGEEAEGDPRGARGALRHRGQSPVQGGRSGSLAVKKKKIKKTKHFRHFHT